MGSLVAELAEKLSAATNSLDFDEQTMFLNTSANTVGIGTNAPASKLDVRGTMQVGVDDIGYDVKFFGDTASKYWLWDTDADGVLQLGTLTVGAQTDGYDVKFFGASASAYLMWDESADTLEIRGPAATAGKLLLSTAEPTVVDGNILGQIDFQAPGETGTDAIAVAASIWAEADATFTASVNSTELVFATGASEVAAEKMRITSTGQLGINTATPVSLLDIRGTFQVGVAGTGYDTYWYGDTSGEHVHWDTSEGHLILGTTAKLCFHDAGGGENIVATADGHLEINSGTTLDITAPTVDINASTLVQIDGPVSVGVDNTGHDVKFFGATTGRYMLWDESEDALHLPDSTELKLGSHADGDINMFHNGSHGYLENRTGGFNLATQVSGTAVSIGHSTSETTINDNLTITGTLDVAGATVFNEAGGNVDFRIEGDANANIFCVNGGSDKIGIGTSSPSQQLEVELDQNAATWIQIDNNTSGTAATAGLVVDADAASGQFRVFSSAFTNSGYNISDSMLLMAASSCSGGFNIVNANSSSDIALWTNSLERFRVQSNGDLRLFGVADSGKVRIEHHTIACTTNNETALNLGSSGTGIGWMGPDADYTNAPCASFGFHVSGTGGGNYDRSITALNTNRMGLGVVGPSTHQSITFTPTAGPDGDYFVIIMWLSTQTG